MHAMWLAAVAAATVGVDVGWQPVEDGGMEYIIQLKPHQAQSLKSGDVIEVGVRPEMRDVRRYRIVVGDSALPRRAQELDSAPPGTVTAMDPVAEDGIGRSVVVQPRLAPVAELPATRTTDAVDERLAATPSLPLAGSDAGTPGPTLTIANPNPVPAPNRALADLRNDAGWNTAPAERATYDEAANAASPENESWPRPRYELPAKEVPRYQPGDSVPVKPLDDSGARAAENTISDAPGTVAGAPANPAESSPPSPPRNSFGDDRVPNRYPEDAPAGTRYDWPRAPAEQPGTGVNASQPPVDSAVTRIPGGPPSANSETSRQLSGAAADPPPRYGVPTAPAMRPTNPEFTERPVAVDVAPSVVPALDRRQPRYSETPAQPATTFVAAAAPGESHVDHDHEAHKPSAAQTSAADNPDTGQNDAGQAASEEKEESEGRPWFPLTLTLFALFASVGGNLYLGWVTWDIRMRFRELLFRTRRDGEGPRVDDPDDDYETRRDI